MKAKYFAFAIVIVLSFPGLAGVELNKELTEAVNLVLGAGSQVHSALYSQDEVKIDSTINEIIKKITLAKQTSRQAREHERHHIDRMLGAVESHFRMALVESGPNRIEEVKSAFQQLVQIAKVYKTERYRIYFCSKDRSVWLQKSGRPKNPFHPKKYRHCGLRVR